MTLLDLLIVLGIAALVLCPAKYDPAIMLKDWTERKREEREP